jgi:O-antigen ligase
MGLGWGLALIALVYILYVPVGRALIHNELVYGPNGLSEKLQTVWSAGRYFATFILAPLLMTARTGVRPLFRCWPVFPFAIFAAGSCLWSAFPGASVRECFNLFAILAIVSTLVCWYGVVGFGRRAQVITAALMIASVLTALFIPRLGVHHSYDLIEPLHAGRWRGIFRHKNELGGLAVTSIILSLRSIRNETTAWKAFFIVGRVAAVVCWIMARSADAWLGGMLAITFFAMMRNRLTANPFAIGLMLLCGGVLVEALSLSSEHVAAALGRDPTFSGRTTVWILGRTMIHKHLLLGSGFATDGPVFGQFAKNSLFASAVDLHSGYLDVLFNVGLVGAVLMILAVAGAMLRGYTYVLKHSGEERDQAVIFMSLVVAGCTMAVGEVSPFYFGGDGAVMLWTAVPALYQLGATWREQRLRAFIRAQGGVRFGAGALQPQWRQAARPYAAQITELAPAGQGDAST